MVESELLVKNKLGLHARPAALLVKKAAEFNSKIEVSKDGLVVDGKSIMGIMMLAAESGSKLLVKIDGADETDAMNAITELFDKRFYEE